MLLVFEEERFIKKIKQIFNRESDVIYGYTDTGFSPYSKDYKSAIVFAVPCEKQLTVKTYTEESFYNGILSAEKRSNEIVSAIEHVFTEANMKYYVPRSAESFDEDLTSEFSLKFAAVNAGLGWIGKNNLLHNLVWFC